MRIKARVDVGLHAYTAHYGETLTSEPAGACALWLR